MTTRVNFERCLGGRLNDAYPVARHDIEVRFVGHAPTESALVEQLDAAYRHATSADPACRKVVFAAPAGNLEAIAAAEEAGFRYVVDVDIPTVDSRSTVELALLVREPEYVTHVDMDLDRVPGS
jgi:hypothetical protein